MVHVEAVCDMHIVTGIKCDYCLGVMEELTVPWLLHNDFCS
jgi:hypothetical protein